MNRLNENGVIPTRNSRFYKENSYWYYITREGFDIGPFDTRSNAEEGARSYIDFVIHAEQEVINALKKYTKAA